MLMRPNKTERAVHGCLCSGLKLYLVDLRGNARYHVAIMPNEWLSAYVGTLICEVFL